VKHDRIGTEILPVGEGRSLFARYAAAAASAAAGIGLRMILDPVLGNRGAYLFFMLAVVVSAWYGGYGPALLATLIGVAAVDWCFLSPRHSFPFQSFGIAVLSAGYALSAFLVALIVRALVRARDRLAAEVEAHRQSLRRLQTISHAGETLSEPLALEEAYDRILRLIVPGIADWSVLEILQSDGQRRRAAVAHADPDRTAWAALHLKDAVPWEGSSTGAPDVEMKGTEEFYPEMSEPALLALGRDPDHVRFLREMEARAGIVIPLRARGRNVGDVVVVWGSSRSVPGPLDLSLLRSLADRAALALDTIHLLAQAQEEASRRRRSEEKVWELNARLEDRVRERTSELREALKELEAFAYTIAHDLRAPLRAQAGFSELLLQEYGDRLDEGGREYLARIKGAAYRMDALVQDVLTYSRLTKEEIHLEPVPVGPLLAELLERGAGEIRSCGARVTFSELLPEVLAHRVILEQVLSNLLSNAMRFVEPGVEPRICVRGEVRESWVRLWVEDNGIGVPPAYHEKIFGVFERLEPDHYPGNGIGLAIVRKGVERMGGRVGVESERGKGSRFWIELANPQGKRGPRLHRALGRGQS
jgi:signal transduction histidine kinase